MKHKYMTLIRQFVGIFMLLLVSLQFFSCDTNAASVSGLYSGIIQDTDNHRLECLLQLDSDMHYRFRTIDLSVSPVLWLFEEGTWYLEQNAVGLMRNGKKDIRFSVKNNHLVVETAQAAFPELPEETLSLFRISK